MGSNGDEQCRVDLEEMEMNKLMQSGVGRNGDEQRAEIQKAQFLAAGGACKATFCISVAFNFSQWTKFSQHTLNPLAKLYTTALQYCHYTESISSYT